MSNQYALTYTYVYLLEGGNMTNEGVSGIQ